jgi:signal recognition particle subunit SRP54
MFGSLTEKFQNLFSSLSRNKELSEKNIADAVRDVRLALLDADVSYTVVSRFIKSVKEKVVGYERIKGVKATEQFISLVHEELIHLMGGDEVKLNLKKNPALILLCGLQGSGKTTHAAKLALFLKKKEFQKRPLLVACDLQRPAAIQQLEILGSSIEVPVFTIEGERNPLKVVDEALIYAKQKEFDVVIFDTAGRLHVDEDLMGELKALKEKIQPHETLFIASAAAGQDAVKVASVFDQEVGITGSILTMLDGTARAGAAISIREVTKKPLLFEGIGEKVQDFQAFHPASMADRILGMGDVINLVKKAQEHIDEEESEDLERKFLKASFTYNDYLKQMASLKKMGPLKSLMKMLPGASDLGEFDQSEKEFSKMEAMILSMTPRERKGLDELIPSRKRRIACGSGTKIEDVNRMIKGFKQLKQFSKHLPAMKKQFMNMSK